MQNYQDLYVSSTKIDAGKYQIYVCCNGKATKTKTTYYNKQMKSFVVGVRSVKKKILAKYHYGF